MAFELQKQNQVSPLIKSHELDGNHEVIRGLTLQWIRYKMQLNILKLIRGSYSSPMDWLGALRYIIKLRRQFLGHHSVQKMIKSNGKYY